MGEGDELLAWRPILDGAKSGRGDDKTLSETGGAGLDIDLSSIATDLDGKSDM